MHYLEPLIQGKQLVLPSGGENGNKIKNIRSYSYGWKISNPPDTVNNSILHLKNFLAREVSTML